MGEGQAGVFVWPNVGASLRFRRRLSSKASQKSETGSSRGSRDRIRGTMMEPREGHKQASKQARVQRCGYQSSHTRIWARRSAPKWMCLKRISRFFMRSRRSGSRIMAAQTPKSRKQSGASVRVRYHTALQNTDRSGSRDRSQRKAIDTRHQHMRTTPFMHFAPDSSLGRSRQAGAAAGVGAPCSDSVGPPHAAITYQGERHG